MTVLIRRGARLLRSGNRLLRRPVQPALPVGTVPPPPAPDPAMPTTPHLTLRSVHAHAIVTSQDGRTAHVRLKRPIYPYTYLMQVVVNRSSASPRNNPYWGSNPGFLNVMQGELGTNREIKSSDDGSRDVQIYQEMSDGTTIRLDVKLSVSPEATGEAPPPSPPPAQPDSIFFEDFLPRTGTGALWVNSGNVENTGNGTVRIWGRGSANQEFGGKTFGFPNGYFEYRSRFFGADVGNGSGPCQLLWPADDIWPGSEIDLGELMTDGTFYHAIHYARDGNIGVGGDTNDQDHLWAPKDNPQIAPGGVFDHTAWHTHGALLTNTRVVLTVNGKVLADYPTATARDAANGGVNHGFGILCGSDERGLEVDWLRWTPLRLAPAF